MRSILVLGGLTLLLCGCSESVTGPASPGFMGGLVVEDLRTGSGAAAQPGDTLTVTYSGWLEDGTLVDASTRRPFVFVLGKGIVIRGFDVGLRGMRVGGLRRLTIPPEMAYGSTGIPPVIPPDATLIFEVELVDLGRPRLLSFGS